MEKILIPVVIIIAIAFFYFRSNTNNELANNNIKIGTDFLAANKVKEGIVETNSGLQYLYLTHGQNNVHPKSSDKVKVHYHGTLLDGTVFDSSVDRGQPISFALNQVIKGWTEGLQFMVVGDKVRFFIPSNLAYGNRTMGKIEAGSLLIFDVELIAINQ